MTAEQRRQRALVFELTQRCNHDCRHCYNAWKNRQAYPQTEELSTGTTIAMMAKVLDETGAEQVSLTGGEPLLRADLFELVDFLASRGTRINLITNGSRLDEGSIERLVPNKVHVFELPLLAGQRDLHDRLSGSAGAFDAVTRAIADLKLADQVVITVFVAMALNLPEWPHAAELALALGADGIMFNRFNPGGRGFENLAELQPSLEALRRGLDQANAFVEQYDLPVSCAIALPPCLFEHERWPRLGFGLCAAGTERAYYTIDPVGRLRPCNHSATVVGNVLEQPFWRLIDSEPMRQFVSALPEFCAPCRFAPACRGGCKAAAEVCLGSPTVCEPFLAAHCERARR